MAKFVEGRPVKTEEPFVTVDPGLPAGVHLFQLQVVNAEGRQSPPDVLKVQIVEDLDRLRELGRVTLTDLRRDPLRAIDRVVRDPIREE